MPDRRWRLGQLALALALALIFAPVVARAADLTGTGPSQIDPGKAVFYPDQGRVEIEGDRLAGVRLRSSSSNAF